MYSTNLDLWITPDEYYDFTDYLDIPSDYKRYSGNMSKADYDKYSKKVHDTVAEAG